MSKYYFSQELDSIDLYEDSNQLFPAHIGQHYSQTDKINSPYKVIDGKLDILIARKLPKREIKKMHKPR